MPQPPQTPKQRRRRIVALNLRRYRLNAGLSQEQLAHRLELRREHISRWETEIWEPSPEYIEQLADILDVSQGAFYDPPEATEEIACLGEVE